MHYSDIETSKLYKKGLIYIHPLITQEEKVMEVLWALEHPCLISEVLKADPTLKRNTVAKVLVSLEHKGYIRVDSIRKTISRTGRAYVPTLSRKAYEEQNAMISALTSKSSISETALSFISTMLESESADGKFIAELEKMIEAYKNKRE